jgi:hypothetical protein
MREVEIALVQYLDRDPYWRSAHDPDGQRRIRFVFDARGDDLVVEVHDVESPPT